MMPFNFTEAFRRADCFINGKDLQIAGTVFQFNELSFHVQSKEHRDPWTYGLPNQLKNGSWHLYYRAQGDEYPLFEYVFGHEGCYAAILIRGLTEQKHPYNDEIIGPGNVAKKVSELLSLKNRLSDRRAELLDETQIQFTERRGEKREIYFAPRPNLKWNDKSAVGADFIDRVKYKFRNYRFFTTPENVLKLSHDESEVSPLLNLSLILNGNGDFVRSEPLERKAYYGAFVKGLCEKLSKFENRSELSSLDECELFGSYLSSRDR